MITSAVATRLLMGCIAFCLTSCGTPPGKGRKADAGYKAAAPVIVALEKFQSERGHYPATLDELIPAYLPDSKALLVRRHAEPARSPRSDIPSYRTGDSWLDWFIYRPDGETYSLMFSYAGPGMNTCT